jgi:predicted 3-demethylubiquinone-9 3-methyltransferase (glyoxalase superfamily)
MPLTKQMITPCLWFDSQAEEAANFYCSVFENSKVMHISRYPEAGQEIHKKPPGTALNGGPNFKFDECETQEEIDYYSSRLAGDGGQEGPCGWLKDKFGLSWQVVPTAIPRMMGDPDNRESARVMNAFMKMKKLDLAALERAYAGQAA